MYSAQAMQAEGTEKRLPHPSNLIPRLTDAYAEGRSSDSIPISAGLPTPEGAVAKKCRMVTDITAAGTVRDFHSVPF